MNTVARILHLINLMLFLGLLWIGAQRYLTGQSPLSQVIVLAVGVVGPLEDILKGRVRRGPPPLEEAAVVVVDKATSAVFLALLLWVVLRLP
ncbi:MAG: hypothetical protein QN131_02205 [Armatimonadota bacterium]|nr:hypothetical protein [Armatimonadota bacterium]MDR7548737.1 hypothetical protein [Armatimonadota bacterium]